MGGTRLPAQSGVRASSEYPFGEVENASKNRDHLRKGVLSTGSINAWL
jgi:hypothetical protein